VDSTGGTLISTDGRKRPRLKIVVRAVRCLEQMAPLTGPTARMPARRSLGADDPAARMPGQHARSIVLRLRMRTLVTLGVLAILTGIFGRAFGLSSPLFVGSELALLVAIFLVSRYVLPLVERHDRGATGEERVGALLESLSGSGWRILHDASLGHGNVDHIALGPGGLYTIETKSHPGPVQVRQIHGAVIRQAQTQREALEKITGERAEALIVYSRAWVDRPRARRNGVRVLPARMLTGHLARSRSRLGSEQVDDAHRKLVAALRRGELLSR
jgi:Nuclease-related domain